MMKLQKALLFFVGFSWAAGMVGCGASYGHSGAERAHTYKTIMSKEWRMAKDDFDNFMLMDRPSRLTRWH